MKKTEAIHIHRNQVAWAKQLDTREDLDIVVSLPKYTSEISTRPNALQAKKKDHLEAVLTLAEELAASLDPDGEYSPETEKSATEHKQEKKRELVQ